MPEPPDDIVADTRAGPVLRIRVVARSSRSGVIGVSGGAVRVAVRSPPERGRATAEALGVLASWLGVAASRLSLAGGATTRQKRVLVAGETVPHLRKRLSELAGQAPPGIS
jgi:hypothetical protein